MYGSFKHHTEKNPVKKIAYRLFGDVHVPGRLRTYHVLRALRGALGSKWEGRRFLDAGSGRGDLLLHLAQKYPRCAFTGLEYEEEKVDLAKAIAERLELGNVSFRKGDLCAKIDMEPFDVVTSCDVLEHIEHDVEAMKNLRKLLLPGGLLVLTFPSVPQRKHLSLVAWREKRIGFRDSDYGHVRQGYSIEGITEMLTGVGFEDVRCRYTFGFWGTLSFDLFFVLGDNKPHPLVFLAAFPLLMLLAWLDLVFPSRQGSALLVTARRGEGR